jgi:hypothetical protein
LNEQRVRSIKDYTDFEEIQIRNISELIVYLKSLPKNYEFDNAEINSNIREKYDDFEIENLKMRLRNRYSGFPYENQR